MIRTGYLIRVCLSVALGGFLFGYDWVVIGGATKFYEAYFELTSSWAKGVGTSSALIGCFFGALLSALTVKKVGCKKLLLVSAVLFVISALGTGGASSFILFCFFRLLGGIGIGLASILSPMYIAEVSPAEYRGRFVTLNQLAIVLGILASQIVNAMVARDFPDSTLIGETWNVQYGWRWMFVAEVIPAFVFLCVLPLVPESPKWLISSGQLDQARRVLTRIGEENYAETEIDSVMSSLGQVDSAADRSYPGKILRLGIFLAVFQQWCGINIIFTYAHDIFSNAGYPVGEVMQNIVITGLINLAFTIVALQTVDRLGRRALLLSGAIGLTFVFMMVGIGFFANAKGLLMLLLVVVAIALYALSLAPVTWVVISEIFPNRERGRNFSICVCALWLSNALLTLTYPVLVESFGIAGTFVFYGVICFAGSAVIWAKLPETKNLTLEQIQQQFETGVALNRKDGLQ